MESLHPFHIPTVTPAPPSISIFSDSNLFLCSCFPIASLSLLERIPRRQISRSGYVQRLIGSQYDSSKIFSMVVLSCNGRSLLQTICQQLPSTFEFGARIGWGGVGFGGRTARENPQGCLRFARCGILFRGISSCVIWHMLRSTQAILTIQKHLESRGLSSTIGNVRTSDMHMLHHMVRLGERACGLGLL